MVHRNSPSHTTAFLADRLGGELVGCADLEITGVNALAEASAHDISFIIDSARVRQWRESQAGAVVVSRGIEIGDFDRDARACIVVSDAEYAMIDLLGLFSPKEHHPAGGIHPAAIVAPDVRLGDGVAIGPHVTIERGSSIGDRVTIFAGVHIYRDVTIGADTVLHANVVIRDRCRLGRRVTVHSGAAIGSDGFGYRPSPDGHGLVKIPHVGIVIVEDDVEIGANSCIDRGKFGPTVIGTGTKIDNLVQIAHNCRIGKCCVIAALTGIAGSVTLGDHVQVAGAVGIADHVTIGEGARLAGKAAVMRDVPPGETHFGVPAGPVQEELRQKAILRKLRDWMQEVTRRLDALDGTDRK